jgi:hypothetical protein
MVDSAALHTTFSRRQATDREVEIATAESATTAPGRAKTELRNPGTNRRVGGYFVVKTFP